eukprot:gnl/Dysnectes_brevis/4141_a5456_442.p1 GENE.gnl/Dysnectes_brevis/4141_a5456_442~~gnl/Dysnectes_brevis/4141_a5456_442.p1  ORF type:complete len:1882 (-),score=496.31 gnl/Dysnectes_brevis/4141_a5456_442:102-5747(-)
MSDLSSLVRFLSRVNNEQDVINIQRDTSNYALLIDTLLFPSTLLNNDATIDFVNHLTRILSEYSVVFRNTLSNGLLSGTSFTSPISKFLIAYGDLSTPLEELLETTQQLAGDPQALVMVQRIIYSSLHRLSSASNKWDSKTLAHIQRRIQVMSVIPITAPMRPLFAQALSVAAIWCKTTVLEAAVQNIMRTADTGVDTPGAAFGFNAAQLGEFAAILIARGAAKKKTGLISSGVRLLEAFYTPEHGNQALEVAFSHLSVQTSTPDARLVESTFELQKAAFRIAGTPSMTCSVFRAALEHLAPWKLMMRCNPSVQSFFCLGIARSAFNSLSADLSVTEIKSLENLTTVAFRELGLEDYAIRLPNSSTSKRCFLTVEMARRFLHLVKEGSYKSVGLLAAIASPLLWPKDGSVATLLSAWHLVLEVRKRLFDCRSEILRDGRGSRQLIGKSALDLWDAAGRDPRSILGTSSSIIHTPAVSPAAVSPAPEMPMPDTMTDEFYVSSDPSEDEDEDEAIPAHRPVLTDSSVNVQLPPPTGSRVKSAVKKKNPQPTQSKRPILIEESSDDVDSSSGSYETESDSSSSSSTDSSSTSSKRTTPRAVNRSADVVNLLEVESSSSSSTSTSSTSSSTSDDIPVTPNAKAREWARKVLHTPEEEDGQSTSPLRAAKERMTLSQELIGGSTSAVTPRQTTVTRRKAPCSMSVRLQVASSAASDKHHAEESSSSSELRLLDLTSIETPRLVTRSQIGVHVAKVTTPGVLPPPSTSRLLPATNATANTTKAKSTTAGATASPHPPKDLPIDYEELVRVARLLPELKRIRAWQITPVTVPPALTSSQLSQLEIKVPLEAKVLSITPGDLLLKKAPTPIALVAHSFLHLGAYVKAMRACVFAETWEDVSTSLGHAVTRLQDGSVKLHTPSNVRLWLRTLGAGRSEITMGQEYSAESGRAAASSFIEDLRHGDLLVLQASRSRLHQTQVVSQTFGLVEGFVHARDQPTTVRVAVFGPSGRELVSTITGRQATAVASVVGSLACALRQDAVLRTLAQRPFPLAGRFIGQAALREHLMPRREVVTQVTKHWGNISQINKRSWELAHVAAELQLAIELERARNGAGALFLSTYNRGQRNAIARAMAAYRVSGPTDPGLVVLQGPPGTGKTSTVAGLVFAMLLVGTPRHGTSVAPSGVVREKKRRPRILVLAASNLAVDVLTARISQGFPPMSGTLTASLTAFQQQDLTLSQAAGAIAMSQSTLVHETDTGRLRFKPNVVRGGLLSKCSPAVRWLHLDTIAAGGHNSREIDALMALALEQAANHDFANAQKLELEAATNPPLAATCLRQSSEFRRNGEEKMRRRRSYGVSTSDIKSFAQAAKKMDSVGQSVASRARVMGEADVVCTTLASSRSKGFLDALALVPNGFDAVLIEEAGQAAEPECIMGLGFANFAVLAGDHQQLPPTVLSDQAEKAGFRRSLMERLVSSSTLSPQFLNRQYRMMPDIAAFPSARFYKGRLLTDPAVLGGAGTKLSRSKSSAASASASLSLSSTTLPLPGSASGMFGPYLIIDLGATEEKRQGKSWFNPREAMFVARYVRLMLDVCPSLAHKVGVIAGYRAQTEAIKRQLQDIARYRDPLSGEYQLGASGLGESSALLPQALISSLRSIDQTPFTAGMVDVNTVDGFQGQEKSVVVFSTTRACVSRGVGFLQDPRRVNVALTRAKHACIIIGNVKTLERSELWKQLVEDSRRRGCLIKAHWDDLVDRPHHDADKIKAFLAKRSPLQPAVLRAADPPDGDIPTSMILALHRPDSPSVSRPTKRVVHRQPRTTSRASRDTNGRPGYRGRRQSVKREPRSRHSDYQRGRHNRSTSRDRDRPGVDQRHYRGGNQHYDDRRDSRDRRSYR